MVEHFFSPLKIKPFSSVQIWVLMLELDILVREGFNPHASDKESRSPE